MVSACDDRAGQRGGRCSRGGAMISLRPAEIILMAGAAALVLR